MPLLHEWFDFLGNDRGFLKEEVNTYLMASMLPLINRQFFVLASIVYGNVSVIETDLLSESLESTKPVHSRVLFRSFSAFCFCPFSRLIVKALSRVRNNLTVRVIDKAKWALHYQF
jgi:hypothetical protein